MLFCAFGSRLWADGSGLNVAVVVNQNSTNSVQLGNYYCEKRQVPPQNLLRASWSGSNIAWQKADFQSVIVAPLLAMLSARQLTNQIDYVLLSLDFPYRVTATNGANSTTTALFYGFVPDDAPPSTSVPASCSLPNASSNAYAGSENLFRAMAPGNSRTNFLTVMLTASNLAQAKLVVDRGVASDSTFPTQTVFLAKSDDTARNIRYTLFDNAIFDTRLRGDYSMQRTNTYSSRFLGSLLGYENGYANAAPTTNFVPGALADQLTSYGGQLYEQTDHTTALQFLNAGAAGSYGTIVEPCAYLVKFPAPQNYFCQARGFTMAESYYQSVTNPYQGLLLGEPLSAPFARPAGGSWNGLPANALLSGTTNLSLQVTAADPARPVQQVDLFVDGTFAQTLTNIPPRTNNVLYVTLNGYPTNYTVPAGASVRSVVSNLTLRLNRTSYTNATKIRAIPHGDRIELRSIDLAKTGDQVGVSVSNSVGSASVLSTFIAASRTSFLDTIAYGARSFAIYYAPATNNYLLFTITRTNGAVVKVGVTNTSGSTSLSTLVQTLVNVVNATPELQDTDGVIAEDFIGYDSTVPPQAKFNMRARSAGWNAAQLQAALSGSSTFTIQPVGGQKLDQNLPDLQPRNHLYVTAGLTNLSFSFPFNSAILADGCHELTAVAYEGSHVHTQKRLVQAVRVQNSPLSAVFTMLYGGSNTLVGATLQFSVVANTNTIAQIELFSTGGSLGSVSNQSQAVFSVVGTNLGVGLHPFYAVVTAGSGRQYRTETAWIRLVTAESPFQLLLTAPPPTLAWTATAGRSYDILSQTNIAIPFQLSGTLTPSNSAAQWIDTNSALPRRFYRVRASN